jgi:RNA 3'-terminal phosphate cyclase (ATP)
MEFAGGARAGFTAFGRKGLPAERVAEAACQDLLEFYQGHDASVDEHLADQLIVPLSLAAAESRFTTVQISRHLRTNMWVVEQFELARFQVVGQTVTVHPQRGGA